MQIHDAALSTENRRAESFWAFVARRLNEEIGIQPPFTVDAVKRRKHAMEELAREQGKEAPISTGWAKKQCGVSDTLPAPDTSDSVPRNGDDFWALTTVVSSKFPLSDMGRRTDPVQLLNPEPRPSNQRGGADLPCSTGGHLLRRGVGVSDHGGGCQPETGQ